MNKYLIIAMCALFVSLYGNAATAAAASVAENPFMHQESQDHPNSSLGIHNGDEVPSFSSVPFMAYIDYKSSSLEFHCGAVFLSDEYLLTAAHCVSPLINTLYKENFTVYYGGVNSKNLNTWKSEKIFEWKVFPDFRVSVKDAYDVALISLDSKVDSSVIPIKMLAPENENKCLNYGTTYVDAYGWGITKSGNKSDNLMHMNALLGSPEEIRAILPELAHKYYVPDLMFGTISANGQVGDVGDSGGPLVVNCDGEPYLIGILSWGTRNGVTTFFTRISNERIQKWIIRKMKNWD